MKIYLQQFFNSLCQHEEGTTTVEYALLLAVIVVSCIAAILGTGDVQKAIWFDSAARIQEINP